MDPPSYMRSDVHRNVVLRRMTILRAVEIQLFKNFFKNQAFGLHYHEMCSVGFSAKLMRVLYLYFEYYRSCHGAVTTTTKLTIKFHFPILC
jgi:hypothetical protein